VNAVVLDWDGTLADSHGRLYAANAAVVRSFGLPFDEDLYRRHYSPDWRLMYRSLGIPAERMSEANRIWEDAFDGVESTTLFPGVRDALVRLAERGFVLGLVTAGPRAIVDPQIVRLGLQDLIPVRIYGDDLPEQKPHPAPLRRALGELGLAAPVSAAYLGDSPDDMRMARSAGVRAVGVTSGMSRARALEEAGAQETVDAVSTWAGRLLAASPAGG